MKKIKKDIMFLSGVLLTAVVLWLIPRLFHADTPARVRIFRDGREIGAYLMAEERMLTITCEDESYNLILISDGQVCVSDADCPDGLCIRQSAISREGESIICLPHKLVIQIESKEESDLDAVTY